MVHHSLPQNRKPNTHYMQLRVVALHSVEKSLNKSCIFLKIYYMCHLITLSGASVASISLVRAFAMLLLLTVPEN
jgi:hypothetical protein